MSLFRLPFLIVLLLLTYSSCSSDSLKRKSDEQKITVQYEDFQKVLSPRGRLLPIPGQNKSLVLMRMPSDKYSKIYFLDHKSKKFEMAYDGGRNISYIQRDPTLSDYYFYMDSYGDENHQIYKLDSNFKKAKKVFGREGFDVSIFGFSQDGKTLYVRSNHLNKKYYSLFSFSTKTGLAKRLTKKKESFDDAVLSINENYVALVKAIGNNETHLFLLDVKQGTTKKLFIKKGTNFNPTFFDKKETTLYIDTNDGRDRRGCAKINLSNPSQIEWIYSSPDKDYSCHYNEVSDYTLVVESFDGKRKIRAFKGIFDEEYKLPLPTNAVVSQLTILPNDDKAYTSFVTSNSPKEFYTFKLAGDGTLNKISHLNRSGLTSDDFASSFDLHYKSFDGMKIHGIIYAKEEWLKSEKKRPVIVWPHGGPDSYEMHLFHPFFQYWALNGYVVFAPNFRGSAGYGKEFETLNDKDWGGGHINDVIWGKRELEKLPYVDAERIFIVGASFGGFSTLSAITEYPKEFKGAVAIVALANLFTFFKSIPPDPAWQNEFLTEMGDPVKDAILYRERSPYFNAHKVSIPLKIYQAENDVRTVKEEMDNFVKKLEEYNIPVEYEVLLKEGHRLARKESWQKVLQGTVEFLGAIK